MTPGPWDVSVLELPDGADAAGTLTFLLRYAVLAPSGHNTQPWLFGVQGDTVDLYADRTKALPVVDPADRELTISCGAALLNLRLALRRFGYRDDAYETLPEPADRDLLARIRLVDGEPPSPDDEALFAAIPHRRTTRAAYDGRAVPAGVQRALDEGAAREGASLHVVGDDAQDPVADLIAEADRVQMHDKRFRRELASWVHPNRSRAAHGMRGYGFGMGDLMSLAGPLVIRTFDLGKGQAAKDRELAERSPLLCVLGTAGDSPRDWLAAGQAMQRAVLVAASQGLTSSYLNQPVEVEEVRPRLAAAIGSSPEHPQLVLRFGYGPDVRHAPRRAVQEVLVDPAGSSSAADPEDD